MTRAIVFTVGMFGFVGSAAAQNTSVYTSAKNTSCRTLKADSEGAGSYLGECAGVGGYKLQIAESDIRQNLIVITPSRKELDQDFWRFYVEPSFIGNKLEWRVARGVPMALIAPYNVYDLDSSTKTTPYPMVVKLGKLSACVTDIVKPVPKQREEAQRLADAAANKPCRSAEEN